MKWETARNENGQLWGALWWKTPYESPGLRVEVGLTESGYRPLAFEITFGGDGKDIGVHVGLMFVSLYLGLRNLIPGWVRNWSYDRAKRRAAAHSNLYAYMLDPFQGRRTGVRVFEGSVWLEFWNSDDGPGNWMWVLRVADWFLGRHRHEVDETWTRSCLAAVRLPEGTYPAHVTTKRMRWNRRWWRGWWRYYTTVEVPHGIPVPGKGESDWDLDDDAIYEKSFPSDKSPVFEGDFVNRFALDVLATRQRYASIDWCPRKGWPPHRISA